MTRPTLEHLYYNQVLPLAVSNAGQLVLHASAVAVDGHALVFLGESGRGKSTLAASFARHGYPFLTDDGLFIQQSGDRFYAQPGYPGVRLWDDSEASVLGTSARRDAPVSYTLKSRFLCGEQLPRFDRPLPIARFFLLGDAAVNTVSFQPVAAADALIALVRNSFLLDIEEKDLLSRHFAELTALLRDTGLWTLDYPRSFERLDAVREQILQFDRDPQA